MDIVLSRIIEYINGTLIDDYMYRIGTFIILHYSEMPNMEMKDFIEAGFYEGDVLNFCRHLGFFSFNDFKIKLVGDQQTRLNQISLRMINADADKCLDDLETALDKESFKKLIDEVVEVIFKSERVIIVGDLYPSALAVELQTDLISLGKPVFNYHHFDRDFRFRETDIVIFLSATGRTMRNNSKRMRVQGLCDAYVVLITQNPRIQNYDGVCSDYYIQVLGKYDGIEFNHQLINIFDMIRIRYYQKYFQ